MKRLKYKLWQAYCWIHSRPLAFRCWLMRKLAGGGFVLMNAYIGPNKAVAYIGSKEVQFRPSRQTGFIIGCVFDAQGLPENIRQVEREDWLMKANEETRLP